MPEDATNFDLVVIGGGPGGYGAALYGASAGLDVALVEMNKLGGTCLHVGCIPAKELLETAAVLRTVHEAGEFGVNTSAPTLDLAVTMERKQRVIDQLVGGVGQLLKGRKVSPNVRMMVVPGSEKIKKQATEEGLDEIFRAAGAEWREAGCSMCIAMNGDQLSPGQYSVSTSNRNFEGRQGKGGRTFLASPLTAAASAIEGKVADARQYLS